MAVHEPSVSTRACPGDTAMIGNPRFYDDVMFLHACIPWNVRPTDNSQVSVARENIAMMTTLYAFSATHAHPIVF